MVQLLNSEGQGFVLLPKLSVFHNEEERDFPKCNLKGVLTSLPKLCKMNAMNMFN